MRAAWTLLALGLLALVAWALAPHGAGTADDPAARRLLPPFTEVPLLVTRSGERLPVAGRDGRGQVRHEIRVEGDEVVYRRGLGWARVPASELRRAGTGKLMVESSWHLLGTDRFGRDLLARLLAGGFVSLAVALGAVAGAALLGALIGGLAAAGGRLAAVVLGLATDGVLALPRVVLVMALAALLSPSPTLLVLLLAVTGWPPMARLVRAEVRAALRSGVAVSAQATGARPLRVFVRHLLPPALATLGVAAGLRIGPTVLIEASLSFLGFGIEPPTPSWGNILAGGRAVLAQAWWVATLPGVVLALVVVLINRVVDNFQARVDPWLVTRAARRPDRRSA
jgi:peptide/nickel transport system permease protein